MSAYNVPVIDLETAHALKAVGRKGANVCNYQLSGRLSELKRKEPGCVTKHFPVESFRRIGVGGKDYWFFQATSLGLRAARLAYDKAEGKW